MTCLAILPYDKSNLKITVLDPSIANDITVLIHSHFYELS